MKNRFWLALLSFSLLGFASQASDIVINEIMYHSFHTTAEAEDVGREWVELFNRGPNAVNLHNWKLSKGIDFTFTNITLPPGGFLVVAASRTNFVARYPLVVNVVGDWSGKLSNTEDEIRLLNATDEEVTSVAYADSGEWAVRARESSDPYGLRGWGWLAPHDGEGMSLELINPAMPNQYGQNWAASTVNGGTPGNPNSVVAANTAPFIRNVSHFPLVPLPTEPVAVTARIEDELTNGLSVTLYYRDASSAFPPAFSSLTMFDDGLHGDNLPGDGLFAATVPAQAAGVVVEFYVSATDSTALNRHWPAPSRNAPDLGGAVLPPESGANALYQVDDSTYSGTQPFYRMIMTESERAFLASVQGNLRNSDASAHGTFLSVDANATEEHHSASFRRRGAGSRGSSVPNFRVNFATDHRWQGRVAINLNSQYPHSQIAGALLGALSGLQVEFQQPVQLRVNNANLAAPGSPRFGTFVQTEVPDGDFAKNHFPADPDGNVYRASSGSHAATLAYLGTNPASYINAGYTKTANGAEYDWSDLINLTDVLNNTPDASYVDAVQARVNVPQWMIYFAVFSLLDSKETSLGIGNGDDFAMYRGLFDTRFQLLGHDFDTVLGQGDAAGNVNDSLFRATAVQVVNRFLKRPEFAPLYFRTLTNLIATAFSPEQVSAVLDQHLGSWVSAGTIASMKSFSAARNVSVLAQIHLSLTVSASLPILNGYPRATSSSATLFGFANAVETRSVLVNGVPASRSPWEATWTGTATLVPGINRVLVQAMNSAGVEFERSYIDIWYESGTTVNVAGDISDARTWTAAGGPYNVTAPITITDDGDLTIESGTTVYFAAGAGLTVNGNGRIRAEGTETRHIRFGKNPASGGNWRSLDIINSSSDNRLVYVDFDSVGGSNIGGHTAQIHVNNNSRVFFDHCTWPSTPTVEYISFDNSSFIVQNCVFPTYPAPVPASAGQPEMLHGVNGIPAGGYGIFRDNYFGHTWGFNDTIDFTGGNRPGPILQIIGNVFDGAGDDHLDLDSTDAWIEGNVFMHAHRDPARTDNPLDTASAISGGVDTLGQNSDWTIINNIFYDVDHVVLNKGNSTTTGNAGGRVAFLYNTVSHVAAENSGTPAAQMSVFNWSDNNVVLPDPSIGSGMYAAFNIIHDAPALQRFYNPANLSVIMDNNIFPLAFKGTTNEWAGSGSGNQYADPRLNLAALGGIAVSNVTAAQLRDAFQLRPGSPALGAGFGGRNLGGLVPYGIAISGEPMGTNTSTSATVTIGPGGNFNWGTTVPQPWGWTAFKWRLDNGLWSAVIPITNNPPFNSLPTITVTNLSNGPHTFYVSGRNDAGFFQDDSFVYGTNMFNGSLPTASKTWYVNTSLSRVVINEVLARNVTTLLDNGKSSDLIELYNAGSATVNLADMSITDDPASPRKFVFPVGTTIAPGAYLILHAGNGDTLGKIYTGFGLNDSGDGVYLYDKLANGGGLLDSVVFGLQLPDLSIGRMPDGTWTLTQPTFGAANIPKSVGDPNQLRINEWLAASGEIFQQDFIEIYNTESVPVALGGLGLSHSPMSLPLENIIPPLSFIAASGWQSFVADGDSAAGANHVNFKLPAEGGWFSLAQSNGPLIDMIVYVSQFPDVTQGRSPDGGSTFLSFNQPTPGGGNPGQTIVITPINSTLVPMNQVWKMEASGVNLGTGWRANNYDDSSWFSGQALFYVYDGGGSQVPPVPALSNIPFTNPKQSTVYFRTTFNYNGPLSSPTFLLSQVIDDGCVIYLNNQEFYRYNLPIGSTITYNTLASTVVSGGPSLDSGIVIPLTNLVAGMNYLAVEVHQQSLSSSDIAMGIQIDSQMLTTNYLGTPIVLSEVFTKNNSYTNAAGKAVDWVELYNPSTNIVDISDLSLTDDPTIPRRWAFPQGAAISPGGYYVVEFDDSAPYSPFNAGFELSADSGAVYLFHRPSSGGSLLDVVVYGVQVADLTLSRAVAGQNNSWTLGLPTRGTANVTVPLGSAATLKVNEWMPNPPAGEDDWFEVYNPDSNPVALSGLHLTDDLSDPIKHTIRPLSFIGAGIEGYVKFIADNDTAKGADHVNFKLASTESVGLYTSNAVPTKIDSVSFVSAQDGLSYGRLPDGSSNIVSFPDSASPEEPNWLPLAGTVVINEILSRPGAPMEQAIELRNISDVDVAIGGWFLSNAKKDLKRFVIPAGVFVPAGGFKVFYEQQFNPNNDVPPSFAFNSFKDDELYLSVADANGNLTGYRTSVKLGASAAGVSFGRYEKSTGDDFVAMSARTFGVDNPATVAQFRTGIGASNAYPIVGPVVITEVHYHPPDLVGALDDPLSEFIEIFNTSASPVALYDLAHPTNTWRFRDAVDFNFPANTVIPGLGYLLVVGFDPATNATALANFRSKYGVSPSAVIFGPWSGKLDNSSDSIELLRPDAPVSSLDPDAGSVPYISVERVKYSDSQPWPSAADGGPLGVGMSLQRKVALDYGNDPVNWIAGTPTPAAVTGPAGGQTPIITSEPTNRVVTAGSNVGLVVSATSATPLSYQWRFNGVVLPNATNASLILINAQASRAGLYTVVVANQWGAAVTTPAHLFVEAPPQISQQPQTRTVAAGSDTTFIVTASGGSLLYQWRFNGGNILNATNGALTLANVQLSASGGYDVIVSNGLGATTSVVATLTVLVRPSIVTQPQSQSVIIGNSATLIAAVEGTAPLSYQWRLNGTNLIGATATTLSFPSAQPTNAGNYTLVVTNGAGAVTSAVATLTVVIPPTVTVMARNATASEPGADTGSFSFIRTGNISAPLIVNYSITGSATAGSDYIALSGTVTIPAGSPAAHIVVTVLNDPIFEGDETVVVTLLPNLEYLVGSPSSATVVIKDDDNIPPTVSILMPTNGQLFAITPANVGLSVSVNDADGTVVKVEYFANATNKLGESTSAPFNFTWQNAPAGTNNITARATDNLGSTTVSLPVSVILNALPAVSITSPANGSSYSVPANIPVNVSAMDSDGSVARVELYSGTTLFAAVSNAPFNAVFSTSTLGNYLLRAVAVDDRGARATSSVVNVTVNSATVTFTDAFASRPTINGYTNSANGNNSSATRETGEPPAYNTSTRTVWIQWIAPANGPCTIDLCGSAFDTVLAVYTDNTGGQPSVSTLTLVAQDDDGSSCGNNNSRLTFSAQAGVAYQIRVEGFSSGSGNIACSLTLIPTTGPPIIVASPADQYAAAGGSATFSVSVSGGSPFRYQWRYFGTNLPNATNATLTLNNLSTNNAGPYTVFVTNVFGTALSGPGMLTIIQSGSEYFRIAALNTNGAATLEHYQITGYDPENGQYGRGGIAVSSSQVIVNAGNTAARFSAANLSGGAALGVVYDALVTDLRTEFIYCFGTGPAVPANYSHQSTTLTHLLELNPATGLLTGAAIPLSSPITLRGAYGDYGFFSGYGRAVVVVGREVFHVALPSGAVASLGSTTNLQHNYAFNWGYWGLVESTDAGLSLVYGRNSQTVARTYITSGVTTNFATFSNLGFYNSSMSFSIPRGRWYFDHYSSSQFANGTEVVGYANAQFALTGADSLPPAIIVAPQNAQALVGGRASFAVAAIGSGSLTYQWRFKGTDVPGAVASGLTLLNVQADKVGNYSVVISNAFGSITTAPVALSIALPPAVTSNPVGLTVNAGATVTFDVGHTGDGPFLYQWKFNGIDLLNATNRSHTFIADYYDNGSYNVEVRNAVGVAFSAGANLVVHSPPFFNTQPATREGYAGMDVTFLTAVDGNAPISLQWYKDGAALPGENAMSLVVPHIGPADVAGYRLVATNIYGSVTSIVTSISLLTLDTNSFAIGSLTTNNLIVANVFPIVGYPDYTGLASSGSRVFLNGYGTSGTGPAGSFSAQDLSDGTSVGGSRNGLVSDFKTRKVYCLANGSTLIGPNGGTVSSLVELDGATGQTTGTIITLSSNITLQSFYCAIFSGYGRIMLMDSNNRLYDIALPSGKVTGRGVMNTFNYNYALGFAYRGWGIVEQIGTNVWLAHVRDSQTIERSRVPDGFSETIASFPYLGDYAGNFTLSPSRKRWYYNFYGTSAFGGEGLHSLFSASASTVYLQPTNVPPSFLEQPSDVFAAVKSTIALTPVVEGSLPLYYQWSFRGVPLTGETSETLVLTNVHNTSEGGYSVVVSNTLGFATSAVATVTINYGASSSNSVSLIPLTGRIWRYSQTTSFSDPSWAATNFNDSSWSSGAGGLGVENNAAITPFILTTLTLGRTTYYFRTAFNLSSNFPPGTLLRATTLIDDGAVFYINGREVDRVRIDPSVNPVQYSTFATGTPGSGDAVSETFFWPASNLKLGTNVIAVEAHQNSSGSSDIVMVMGLDALVPNFNRPPVITNQPISRSVSNGVSVAFSVGVSGTTPLTYFWRHDGTNLPGVTGTTLTLNNVGRQHAGVYTVLASNRFDTTLSSDATLVVLIPPIEIVGGGATFTAPGRFTLNFVGDAGAVFAIEISTNLVNWTQTATVTNTTGSAHYDDNSAGSAPMRFYRLRLLP